MELKETEVVSIRLIAEDEVEKTERNTDIS